MPTIYERIQSLNLNPNQATKLIIGKEVASTYFKLPKEKRPALYQVESKEPEGTFMAWSYPLRFVNVIDRIIKKHCPSNKKRRRRIQSVSRYEKVTKTRK